MTYRPDRQTVIIVSMTTDKVEQVKQTYKDRLSDSH